MAQQTCTDCGTKCRSTLNMCPNCYPTPDRFKTAFNEMPDCVETDALAMKTMSDLRFACVIQLDLIAEGQDGTENDDPKAIRRWLRKYGRPAKVK